MGLFGQCLKQGEIMDMISEFRSAEKVRKKRLLIIMCSYRKNLLVKSKALEVYNGTLFKVLKRNLPEDIDILILSAKYGLISTNEIISHYDIKMNPEIAESLRSANTDVLRSELISNDYSEVFVELSHIYRYALDINVDDFPETHFIFDNGTIGVRAHNLKVWLRHSTAD